MLYAGYIICATPRSGSTLLCDLLTAAGAGEPRSYFRVEDVHRWSTRWDLPSTATDAAYLDAARHAGTAATGIFGLRLMWNSLAPLCDRLRRVQDGDLPCAARLEQAFGPLRYIHLSRHDRIAQAVSLVRATQSGLWHIHADGTERQRVAPGGALHYDPARLGEAKAALDTDEQAWNDFFATQGIEPLRLTYEALIADPRRTLDTTLTALGLGTSHTRTIDITTGRMADATSIAWVTRFRREANQTV